MLHIMFAIATIAVGVSAVVAQQDVINERKELMKETLELDAKRTDYIKKEQEKQKLKGGFDEQVLQMLRQQAKKHKIDY